MFQRCFSLAHLEGALALDGDEEAAARAGRVARRHRQVRAAHDADLDLAVLDEGEADGELLAAQEALGAVDGVQRPVPTLGPASKVAVVDRRQQLGRKSGSMQGKSGNSRERAGTASKKSGNNRERAGTAGKRAATAGKGVG